jgi:hypothetical protein
VLPMRLPGSRFDFGLSGTKRSERSEPPLEADPEKMSYPSRQVGRRATCESSLSIDVREWHRHGLLRHDGLRFTWSWTRHCEPLGSIEARTEADAVVLIFTGSRDWKSVEQRVPLVWTKCHFGGGRCWFRCCCGRRAAILYMRNASIFACRHCCDLVFASQREIPRHRAISRAQKLRMRLGGSANLLEPFPRKPPRMHRRTFFKLFNKAAEAQERSTALALEYLYRGYPEKSEGRTAVSHDARCRVRQRVPRPVSRASGVHPDPRGTPS